MDFVTASAAFGDEAALAAGVAVASSTGTGNDAAAAALALAKGTYGIFIDSGSIDACLQLSDDGGGGGASGACTVDFLSNSINGSALFLGNGTTLNGTWLNGTDAGRSADGDEDLTHYIAMMLTSVLLGLMILMTVIGNVFVIAAICVDRNLRSVANYLVASLALADLMVACLVMPFGALYEINRGWRLGPEVCDFWTMCDVLCCTASILHLVAIATDRYWAVTRVDYIHSRTSGRVKLMICMVWTLAIIVSLAPQFGFKDDEYMQRIELQKCTVSQDVAYQIFATCATFYVPLLVILVLYWKIYQTARKRIHRRCPKMPAFANNNQVNAPKNKSRLRFRLASKFTANSGRGKSSLGLVQGNSTNTVNTVEDTDYSSNDPTGAVAAGHGGGGGGGIEVTTTQFSTSGDAGSGGEEMPPAICQISTVSQQVAQHHQPPPPPSSANGAATTPTASATHPNTTTTTISLSTPTSSTATPVPTAATGAHHSAPSASGSAHLAMHQIQSAAAVSTPPPAPSATNPHVQVRTRKETLEAKRERKAAKTLAIITGAFVVCWLPFFLTALVLTLCQSCYISDNLSAFFLWLGYFNSTLNPVIYTIFSPEFRQAFKRLLCGKHRGAYYRGGKL